MAEQIHAADVLKILQKKVELKGPVRTMLVVKGYDHRFLETKRIKWSTRTPHQDIELYMPTSRMEQVELTHGAGRYYKTADCYEFYITSTGRLLKALMMAEVGSRELGPFILKPEVPKHGKIFRSAAVIGSPSRVSLAS